MLQMLAGGWCSGGHNFLGAEFLPDILFPVFRASKVAITVFRRFQQVPLSSVST